MKPYQKNNIPFAKQLRKNMTPWERKLWYEFLRTHARRFQRQKAIESYIVDFYCASARLVIELDGGGHFCDEQEEKDLKRTEVLQKLGLTVLRFSNLDVQRNFAAVCQAIDDAVCQTTPQSADADSSPDKGSLI